MYKAIVVNRAHEAQFRKRAIAAYPNEYIESLWGYIKGGTVYICAFMPFEIKKNQFNEDMVGPREVHYHEEELDHQEEEAKEHNLEFLGTIHTHPDHEDALFSEGDLADWQDSNETIIGICAVRKKEYGKTQRRTRKVTECAYWFAVRPLRIEYKK